MLKNKFAIILLTVVMLFCIVFISSCENSNLMKDGEYNAVRIVNRPWLISWSFDVKELKVEINDNQLFIDGEEIGELSTGELSKDNWSDLIYYHVVEGVDLDALTNIKKCYVVDSKISIYGVDYFYVISNNNNYYLFCASKLEGKIIRSVYLLD